MSSSVFFKFKSQKEPVRVAFDGTGISVFELKRNIITINRLGDGTDFDLAIYNEDTNEEYDDDTTIIPRSTSIIARRLPPAKSGRGGAARYVSGKMPVNALNTSRAEKPAMKQANQPNPQNASNATSDLSTAQTEEERIAAMFKAGAEQWDQQQQEMAQATPVYRNAGNKVKTQTANVPSHPPPNGYICYRCGEKGHWIQECPTNNDPNFDGRPRVKRTTGIPRSFLKTVEKPAALSNDGLTDNSNQPSGIMVNAEGEFVVAEPDKASWEQYQAKTKVSAAAQEAAKSGSLELQERGLECPIDKKLFVEPTRTPCCAKVYCNDCITNALIESDLSCPACHSEGILIDDLTADSEAAAKVKAYMEEKEDLKRQKEKSKSPAVEEQTKSKSPGVLENQKPKSPIGLDNGQPKSPAIINQNTTTAVTNGKLDVQKAPNVKREPPRNVSSPQNPSRATTLTPKPIMMADSNSKKRPASNEPDGQRTPKMFAAVRNHQLPEMPPSTNNFSQPNSGLRNALQPNPTFNVQPNFGNGSYNHGMGQMGYQNVNGFMGIPNTMGPMMGMDPSMMTPSMMSGMPSNGVGYGGMGGMGGMGYAQQQNGMYGQGYQGGAMPMIGGYGNYAPNFQMPNMNNPSMGGNPMNANPMNANMNGMIPGMFPNGVFPNQQRTIFSEPFPNEEDNAYFRKPVNPHRHQARQRRVRPSDYREL
ncbi:MAG: hypothetical protein M1837_000206 [Sclerophora amabilis]|nr:MAG: hypothetical protein M1837_000206 [Sclerophora amabilis]